MTKIGIVGTSFDSGFGIKGNYLDWARNFGTPVIIPPITKDEIGEFNLDALILPGGADVSPERYSKFPGYYTGRSDIYFEWFDTEILPSLIGTIPIFGICRGLQTLNVSLGGTLRQHLWGHPYSEEDGDLVHQVVSPVKGIKEFKVNSFHHQAIDKLSEKLKDILHSKEDKIIEAVIGKGIKVAAVQYHPERFDDPFAKQLFEEILRK